MSMTPSPVVPARSSGGFSLLEVLIAIVVMSFGLLGLVGLQMTAMKNNHSAYHRAQATLLAYDIIDRMRANRDVALAGTYDITMGAAAPGTTTTIVNADRAAWLNALAARLPSGDGSIATTTATSTVVVTIQWDDSRGTDGSTSKQWTLQAQL
jgi:type IV pilus assembly protein PilV